MSTDKQQKEVKILILKWLIKTFGYENYPHSFQDQYINWHIWDGELTISFDSRVIEHNTLLTIIPKRYLGTPQRKTLKVVNSSSFYLTLKDLLDIQYPDIISDKLIKRNDERGGTSGWHSKSDDFYTYDWEVLLSDETIISYHNQKCIMDMIKGDHCYNSIIQKRAFINYLRTNYNL